MLKIDRYSNLEEAFDMNMVKDLDHVLIRHSYRQGRHIVDMYMKNLEI